MFSHKIREDQCPLEKKEAFWLRCVTTIRSELLDLLHTGPFTHTAKMKSDLRRRQNTLPVDEYDISRIDISGRK